MATTDVRDGQIRIELTQQDLNALVLIASRDRAAEHGVQIVETQTTLAQLDARSIRAEVRIKAKKMFVTAAVRVSAKITIDDALTVHATELACIGEGILGDLVSKLIRSELEKVEGQKISLAQFSAVGLRLKEITTAVGDPLVITATLGA